jgi:hypothetical protein
MAEEVKKSPPAVEQLPSVAGGISAIASAGAPFIYFDGVPNYGLNGQIANLTLEVIRFTAVSGTPNPQIDRVSVAHLRMTLPALRSLKVAIEGIEKMASAPPKAAQQ